MKGLNRRCAQSGTLPDKGRCYLLLLHIPHTSIEFDSWLCVERVHFLHGTGELGWILYKETETPESHIGYFGPSHLGPLHTHVAAPYTPPTSPRGSKLSLRLGIGWEGSGFGFLELRDGIAC